MKRRQRSHEFLRATEKMNLIGDARFTPLIERRKAEGKTNQPHPALVKSVVFALINSSDADGWTRLGHDGLALESDASEKSVQRALKVLIEEGIVVAEVRHNLPGIAKEDAVNGYRVVWHTLRGLTDAARATGANGGQADHRSERTPGDRGLENGGRGVHRSDEPSEATVDGESTDRRTDSPPNGGLPVQNGGLPVPATTLGPRYIPSPPLPPPDAIRNGADVTTVDGGGGESSGEGETERDVAERIRAVYPATAGSDPGKDLAAIRAAIAAERARPEGDQIEPEEILQAAHRTRSLHRSGRLTNPRWLRKWATGRLYEPLVRELRGRRRAAAPRLDPWLVDLDRAAAIAAALRERDARIDAAIAELSEAEVEALRDDALQAEIDAKGEASPTVAISRQKPHLLDIRAAYVRRYGEPQHQAQLEEINA